MPRIIVPVLLLVLAALACNAAADVTPEPTPESEPEPTAEPTATPESAQPTLDRVEAPTADPDATETPGLLIPERITVDGLERGYVLHLPPAYDGSTPLPVIVALHGGGGRALNMRNLTDLNPLANQEGFIVVYPQGIDQNWADGRGATGPDQTGVDDVNFILTLLDALAAEYAIDPARVYATGISNGGFMSQRLACEAPDRFAAVASVAATFQADFSCDPARPTPVLFILGTDDPLVPYEGGEVAGERGAIFSAEESVTRWAAINGCGDTPPVTTTIPDAAADGTTAEVTTIGPCAQGSAVELVTVVGGGHTWPGGRQYLGEGLIGKTSRDFSASAWIWSFFKAYAR
ncbi:MAG: prolyl oligopeptidase family serine peptidase [Chloroflexi bacterium]|nr:prolyl oligopeptidase family serine peptidase [Chloroflexota bacterium]